MNQNEKTILFVDRKVLGGRKLLLKRFKTYIFKNMLKLFDNIAKNWFTMLSPDNHIKNLKY